MTINRRDFIQRLSTLMAALGPYGRATLDKATLEVVPESLNDSIDRTIAQHSLETAASPDGPRYGPNVRHGLPPVQWRQLGRKRTEAPRDYAQRLAVELVRPNEILMDIPWKSVE